MSKYVEELQRRIPVWVAISNLFLDTEIQNFSIDSIVRACVQSNYSIDELNYIYRYEVSALVGKGLYPVIGEWAGFDEDWLIEGILKKIKGDLRMHRVHKIKLHPIEYIPLFIRQLRTYISAKVTRPEWHKVLDKLNDRNK